MKTLGLLLKRRAALADLLPVVAFAAATGITLTVMAGTLAFFSRVPDFTAALEGTSGALTLEERAASEFCFFALCACVLLVPNAIALGGSAARLSLTRRERDLAAVRLIGGTRSQVAGVAIADVMVQAVAGGALGVLLHLLVATPLTVLNFGIRPFSAGELILPWWALVLAPVALAILAACSAALTLTGVALSPLGIARGAHAVRMSVLRVIVWALLIAAFSAAAILLPRINSGLTAVQILFVICGFLGLMVAGVNLAGPFFVWITARAVAALSPWPSVLVGARRLAADPRAGWRTIGGVTVALTVAGIATVPLTLGAGRTSADGDILFLGMATGAYLTVGIAAVLAAVATGVSHTARVIDQAPQYRAQHVAGASVAQLHRARVAEILIPIGIALGAATLMAFVVLLALAGNSLQRLDTLALYALAVIASLGLVFFSGLVSSPLVVRAARGAK